LILEAVHVGTAASDVRRSVALNSSHPSQVSTEHASASAISIFASVPSQTPIATFTLPSARLSNIPATFCFNRIFLACEPPASSEKSDLLAVDISYRFDLQFIS